MSTLEEVKSVLAATLQLPDRGAALSGATRLLGSIPELDSMAVVNLVTALEDRFGIAVADDELSADTFATVGALAAFVESKLSA